MVKFWRTSTPVPTMEFGDMSNSDFFYVRGEPTILPVGEKFQVFITLRGRYTPQYDDRDFDKTYQITKAGIMEFTLDKAKELKEKIQAYHSHAHASI